MFDRCFSKKEIPSHLSKFRKYYSLKQAELASQLHMDRTAISKIENGKREMSHQEINYFLKSYNKEYNDYLLNYEVSIIKDEVDSRSHEAKDFILSSLNEEAKEDLLNHGLYYYLLKFFNQLDYEIQFSNSEVLIERIDLNTPPNKKTICRGVKFQYIEMQERIVNYCKMEMEQYLHKISIMRQDASINTCYITVNNIDSVLEDFESNEKAIPIFFLQEIEKIKLFQKTYYSSNTAAKRFVSELSEWVRNYKEDDFNGQ